MSYTKWFTLAVSLFFICTADAQSIRQDTAAHGMTKADTATDKKLAAKVSIDTRQLTGVLNAEGMDDYTYTLAIKNKNDIRVAVTIGGLVYGHYEGCKERELNFVQDGYFEQKTVTIPARSDTTVLLPLLLKSNPPAFCTGVPEHQSAKAVRVVKSQ